MKGGEQYLVMNKILATPWFQIPRPKFRFYISKESLENSSEVIKYNMYDVEHIKSYEEIMGLPLEEGKDYLVALRKRYKMRELMKIWSEKQGSKVGSYHVYGKLLPKFDIETEARNPIRNRKTKDASMTEQIPVTEQVPVVEQIPQKNISAGSEHAQGLKLSIALSGTATGIQLAKRIEGLTNSLSDNANYKISIQLEEISN